ncbi:MBL fold metallo-hydrolase [Hypericibacter terrae]|uniref:MBL fold metallo-hydrolase n=1 Tax=Hypericibacter terrae TaxID=2602015 RepID=A0A5J6MI65_9PROT|nr:MBL fold metallo-hydrolase [Hypericibacter terrae]QEX16857.1 MBL fold metallo-hydrolase [Hypericibacter terrae]
MTRHSGSLRKVLAAAIAFVAFGLLAQADSFAAAPQVRTQAPGFYRLMLGSFEITALNDGTIDFPMDQLLLNAKPGEVEAAFKNAYLRLPAETSVNAFLINTATKLILVDTGAGALYGPTLGHLLDNLRAAGYRPEEVDTILLTHLHGDHVGGLSLNGKMAFPNATLYVNQKEVSYWLNESKEAGAPESQQGNFKTARQTMGLYLAANRMKPFTGDTQLFPGVKAVDAPGHSPGHTMYQIESDGQKLLLWGDLIHAAAVQFADPGVAIQWDSDPKQAVATRQQVLADAAKNGYWIAGAHLPYPAFGHVRADGKGYVFIPINYTQNRQVH